jgi:hypothetical protein
MMVKLTLNFGGSYFADTNWHIHLTTAESWIPVIENNYQLFMIERLILMGAKTFIKTFKEVDNDLSLTDDPKKNTKSWQLPVYTMDEVE